MPCWPTYQTMVGTNIILFFSFFFSFHNFFDLNALFSESERAGMSICNSMFAVIGAATVFSSSLFWDSNGLYFGVHLDASLS